MTRAFRFGLGLGIVAVALQTVVSAAGSFAVANTGQDEATGGVASDGTNYLVSVQLSNSPEGFTTTGVDAQLISPTGARIGGLLHVPGRTGDPARIAFDGTNYLMAWADYTGSPGNIVQVYGQRVTRQGAFLGSAFLISQSTKAFDLDGLAFDGTNFLLVWTDRRRSFPTSSPGDKDVYGRFVSTAGVPVGSEFKISGAAGKNSSIAFGSTNYFVIWNEDVNDAEVHGQFVSPAGAMVGSEFTVNGSAAASDNPTDLAFDGTNFFASYADVVGDGFDLFGQRVSTAGALLGDPITLVAAPGTQLFPRAVFDGTNYLVSWTDLSNDANANFECDAGEGTCIDTYARFISPTGASVGSTIVVAADALNQGQQALAYGGGKFLVAWDEFGGASGDILASFISGSSTTTISINDVSVTEGDAGSTSATFTVTLNAPTVGTVTVQYTTTDLTANAGSDYTATGPFTLTFDPGTVTRTFSVPVLGDGVIEPNETFQVNLAAPFNAIIADGVGIGTILNDDLPSRIFISPLGSDSGDCSTQTTPCRNIAAALTQVAADGEIIVLSSGEYESAPLTINKSVKVTSPSGTVAFVRQPITVNAPGGRVVLRGLTIKGAGTGDGVTLTAGAVLAIEESTIDRWNNGVSLSGGSGSQVAISNSVIRANTSGVQVGAGGTTRLSVEGSRFEGNGFGVDASGGAMFLRETTFVKNTTGLRAAGSAADVQRSEFSLNGTGLTSLTGATIRISRSHVFANNLGVTSTGGGTLQSSGTNVIRGNNTNTSGTIGSIPEQ